MVAFTLSKNYVSFFHGGVCTSTYSILIHSYPFLYLISSYHISYQIWALVHRWIISLHNHHLLVHSCIVQASYSLRTQAISQLTPIQQMPASENPYHVILLRYDMAELQETGRGAEMWTVEAAERN